MPPRGPCVVFLFQSSRLLNLPPGFSVLPSPSALVSCRFLHPPALQESRLLSSGCVCPGAVFDQPQTTFKKNYSRGQNVEALNVGEDWRAA